MVNGLLAATENVALMDHVLELPTNVTTILLQSMASD